MSNEFKELLTFNAESSENYGEGGTEVPVENLDTMESAVSHHMMDSPMDNSAGNLEQLGAEVGLEELLPEPANEVPMELENPLPSPPPVEPMPQPPNSEPSINENVSEDSLEQYMEAHSEDYRDIASMNLADYEDWLFNTDSDAGEIAVARIVSNFKASGYDVKPSFAAVAGATWSRMNYEGEEHKDALRKVERASVASLRPLTVEIESEGMTSLVSKIRKAEAFTEDYRAEIKAEIKAEMKAEQEVLNAEQETFRFASVQKIKGYTTPIAIGIVTLLGISALRVIK